MIEIRRERPDDMAAVHRLNEAAFDTPAEALLVDKLRDACADHLSLVAVADGAVVGHILFTPAVLGEARGMGLAPMAVLPGRQREGIGSRLVAHGLESLRAERCPFVIVLGHPEYYPRFGFERASAHRIACQWEGVPDEAFMILAWDEDALPADGGVARYRDEFDEAM